MRWDCVEQCWLPMFLCLELVGLEFYFWAIVRGLRVSLYLWWRCEVCQYELESPLLCGCLQSWC